MKAYMVLKTKESRDAACGKIALVYMRWILDELPRAGDRIVTHDLIRLGVTVDEIEWETEAGIIFIILDYGNPPANGFVDMQDCLDWGWVRKNPRKPLPQVTSVSRVVETKSDADRIAGWMRSADMATPKITGQKGRWRVTSKASPLQLAKFASREGHFDLDDSRIVGRR